MELDYRDIVLKRFHEMKSVRRNLTYRHLAEAVKIQVPYLSKVLKRRAHFSGDQLFSACEFLKMDPAKWTVAEMLLDYQRTTSPSRRALLSRKITEHQEKMLETAAAIQTDFGVQEEDLARYYLDPYCFVVHIALVVGRYQKNPFLLVEDCGIPRAQLATSLEILRDLHIIELTPQNEVKLLQKSLHLSKTSYLCRPNQTLMRGLIANRLSLSTKDNDYNLLITFAADAKTRASIQQRFLAFLQDCDRLIAAAPCEEVYQIGFDLFSWTEKRQR